MFIDRVKIRVKAGDGGSGCLSFRRQRYRPKGGPDGGDGGKGGDIIIKADDRLATLLDFTYQASFRAGRAEHGKGGNKSGKNGSDSIIIVPLGTVVKNVSSGEILADLETSGQEVVAAMGGRGGRGNARFVRSTNQAPRQWEKGELGEEKMLELELKLIADVGLVGLPNAGKSTLLSKLSDANPRIADYPFTTLKPGLGIVKYLDFSSFVMADIPGLIKGAFRGKGLGLEFLRHIERTKMLLFLIDGTSEDLSQDYSTLKKELLQHNRHLLERPQVVVLTKMDLCENSDFSNFEKAIPTQVCKISSVTGDGLLSLKDVIWQELTEINRLGRSNEPQDY